MPCFITRAEFSRLARVTGAAITIACRQELAPACDGRLIDRDHETAIKYLRRHGVTKPTRAPRPTSPARPDAAPTPPAKPAPPAPAAPTPPPELVPAAPPATDRAPTPPAEPEPPAAEPTAYDVGKLPKDLHDLLDLTLREIVERHGTEPRVKDLLDIRKKLEDIRAKELENDATEGELIARELVRTHVLGAFDASFRRLLENAARTCARELYAAAKSGTDIEAAETKVRDILSREIQVAQIAAAKALR